MKKIISSLFLVTFFFSCTVDRVIPTLDITVDSSSVLIHYWNFNATSGTLSSVAPDFTLLPTSNPQITYDGTGAGYMDSFSPGYTNNARNNDASGNGIRARNPSDTRSLNFAMPTTGYQKIVLKFATAKSSSGASQQNYSYTIDGTNYINSGLNISTFNPSTDPLNDIVAIDFRSISGVDNNPNFKFKITFSGDTVTGTSGNDRFDNVTVEGIALPVDNTLYTIHNWNFSSLVSGATVTSVTADSSLITPNATSITYPGTGAGYMDQVTPATTLNEQTPADANSNALRVRNPSDTRSLIITASTVGYKNIIVKFATDRTNSGATVQNYSYTIDGTNYITTGLSTTTSSPTVDPSYSLVTLDFSSISGASNNPNFKIKIDFAGTNASGASGNNRFDNITFQGNTL